MCLQYRDPGHIQELHLQVDIQSENQYWKTTRGWAVRVVELSMSICVGPGYPQVSAHHSCLHMYTQIAIRWVMWSIPRRPLSLSRGHFPDTPFSLGLRGRRWSQLRFYNSTPQSKWNLWTGDSHPEGMNERTKFIFTGLRNKQATSLDCLPVCSFYWHALCRASNLY